MYVGSLLLASGEALALTPSVFASLVDDGVDPAQAVALPTSTSSISLFLYVDSGVGASTSGTPCIDGNGGEMCGFDVVLAGIDGLTLASFVPEAGVTAHLDTGGNRVLANRTNAASPGIGPQRIGELIVDTGVPPGSLRLTGRGLVAGQLLFEDLEEEDLAIVPEPGGLALAVGLVSLILVRRREERLSRAGRASGSQPGRHHAS